MVAALAPQPHSVVVLMVCVGVMPVAVCHRRVPMPVPVFERRGGDRVMVVMLVVPIFARPMQMFMRMFQRFVPVQMLVLLRQA